MAEPLWTADIEIDAPLAAALVGAQFPQFTGVSVEPLGSGWDNAAFLIDGHAVFRFPRRRIAIELLAREVALLPGLAARLPLAISAPRFVGVASETYPRPFAGYELIVGNTACSVPLSNAERTALARPLARFLRALHGIDPAPMVAMGLPGDELGRLDHVRRLPATRERLRALSHAGLADACDTYLDWLEANPPVALDAARRRVVHGDLYARHIVLDAAVRPLGVIDWGDMHYGDPALDIAIAHLMLPAVAHAVFREAYGPIDDRTWSAARYRAINSAILVLDYGVRVGDAGVVTIGNAALGSMFPALP